MDAEGVEHRAPRTARYRGRVGVALVMVLCGVLFATTARLSDGSSIRDESSDVAGVLQERGRAIEDLTADNEAKRAEIERLRGTDGSAPLAARTAQVEDAVGLSEVRDRKSVV